MFRVNVVAETGLRGAAGRRRDRSVCDHLRRDHLGRLPHPQQRDQRQHTGERGHDVGGLVGQEVRRDELRDGERVPADQRGGPGLPDPAAPVDHQHEQRQERGLPPDHRAELVRVQAGDLAEGGDRHRDRAERDRRGVGDQRDGGRAQRREPDGQQHHGGDRDGRAEPGQRLQQLVAEGLLRREAHEPAYVPVLSEAEVRDPFLVRTPLELEVVRVLAGRRSAPKDAGKAVDDLAAIGPERPHSEFVEADLGFHRALVAAVDSPRLGRVYQALSGEIHLSMVQSRHALGRERIVSEHCDVLGAIEAGDADRAAALMRSHLDGACAALAEKLAQPEPAPRST